MERSDRMMAAELCSTLSAVFDLAAAALASESMEAVAQYRRVGEANLQVAARLLQHLAASGKIRTGAAAGHTSGDPAAPLSTEEAEVG